MSTSLFSLRGRALIVTGGAGHLGRVMCAALRDSGAHVLSLSSKVGEFPVPVVTEQDIGSISSEICDVADEQAFAAAVQRFAALHGGIDGLVNNASRGPQGVNFAMPAIEIQEVFRGAFLHYFTCTRMALEHFRAGSGAIVNNASIWGRVSPDPRTYLDLRNEPSLPLVSAKAAVLQMTKYMAVLLAPKGVRVNAIVPGFFPQAARARQPGLHGRGDVTDSNGPDWRSWRACRRPNLPVVRRIILYDWPRNDRGWRLHSVVTNAQWVA